MCAEEGEEGGEGEEEGKCEGEAGDCQEGAEKVCVMFYGQDANSQYSCADGFTLRDSVQPQVQT